MREFTKQQKAIMAGNQWHALLDAGITARDLLDAGFTARALLHAGFTARALLDGGFTARALLHAGFTARDLLDAGFTAVIPMLDQPYTKMLGDITAGNRIHNQDTFGHPDNSAIENPCGTAMCTAGHLVQMAGEAGRKLREQYGFDGAAALIHEKAHPGWPCQNFGSIPQEWAMAYIEEMAAREAAEKMDNTRGQK